MPGGDEEVFSVRQRLIDFIREVRQSLQAQDDVNNRLIERLDELEERVRKLERYKISEKGKEEGSESAFQRSKDVIVVILAILQALQIAAGVLIYVLAK